MPPNEDTVQSARHIFLAVASCEILVEFDVLSYLKYEDTNFIIFSGYIVLSILIPAFTIALNVFLITALSCKKNVIHIELDCDL